MTYINETLEKALECDIIKISYYELLNGDWRFVYFERCIDVSKNGKIQIL
ncbi:MAG: hypothetical protein IKW59_00855 [Clostridia bacterium]|nr:hypothetical protein [Clostridia bacterium]